MTKEGAALLVVAAGYFVGGIGFGLIIKDIIDFFNNRSLKNPKTNELWVINSKNPFAEKKYAVILDVRDSYVLFEVGKDYSFTDSCSLSYFKRIYRRATEGETNDYRKN